MLFQAMGTLAFLLFLWTAYTAYELLREARGRQSGSLRLVGLIVALEGISSTYLLMALGLGEASILRPGPLDEAVMILGSLVLATGAVFIPLLYFALILRRFPSFRESLPGPSPYLAMLLLGVAFPVLRWMGMSSDALLLAWSWVSAAIGALGILASHHASRRSRGAERRQARAFLATFIARDLAWIYAALLLTLADARVIPDLGRLDVLGSMWLFGAPLVTALTLWMLLRSIYQERFLGLQAAFARGVTTWILVGTGIIAAEVASSLLGAWLGVVAGGATVLAAWMLTTRLQPRLHRISARILGGEETQAEDRTDFYPVP